MSYPCPNRSYECATLGGWGLGAHWGTRHGLDPAYPSTWTWRSWGCEHGGHSSKDHLLWEAVIDDHIFWKKRQGKHLLKHNNHVARIK